MAFSLFEEIDLETMESIERRMIETREILNPKKSEPLDLPKDLTEEQKKMLKKAGKDWKKMKLREIKKFLEGTKKNNDN